MTIESHTMNVDLHSKTKLQLGVELQTKAETHSNSKISVYERDVELPDREVHSDSKVDRKNVENREKPRSSKYVKGHHPT